MALRILTAAAGALVLAGLAASPAGAANFLEKNFWLSGPNYDGVLPACDLPSALGRIRSRFATKEGRFWNSDLRIVGFEKVRETAFRPWASQTIPRRFCSAIALTSEQIGASWGVEWCVVGTDRNWAYNPGCKMAQP